MRAGGTPRNQHFTPAAWRNPLATASPVLPLLLLAVPVVGAAPVSARPLPRLVTRQDASSPFSIVDLRTLGGHDSSAVAVNGRGQVVGSSDTADGFTHAFSWTLAGGMVDLPTLGVLVGVPRDSMAGAAAVNDRGQVVGTSTFGGNYFPQAFSWTQAGGLVELGTLAGLGIGNSSGAAAVNDRGQVVGDSLTAAGVGPHAISWTKAGGMVHLGTLGGSSSKAVAVDGQGQVVGDSKTAEDAATNAVLWEVLCVVPNVKGRMLPAAKSALTKNHCRAGTIVRVYSRTAKKGRVISQHPSAGTKLRRGARVDLVVSRGRRHP